MRLYVRACRDQCLAWTRRAGSAKVDAIEVDDFDEVSDYYHRVLREAIKAVTSMIEPLMIVIMGSIVGFIAMAIILPIFKMSSLVSG